MNKRTEKTGSKYIESNKPALSINSELLAKKADELQTQNDYLREQIKLNNTFDAKLASYKLTRTDAGSMLYKSESGPERYICPVCAENVQKLHILQPRTDDAVSCPECKTSFDINEQERNTNLSGRPRGSFY
jgi:hypothetical protein